VFFHRLGEIRDRTLENQRCRASGLNLAVAAIILWNIVYLGRALGELRSRGEILPDELLAHVAPLGWEHIAFNGDYVWPTETLGNAFRPLRNPLAKIFSDGKTGPGAPLMFAQTGQSMHFRVFTPVGWLPVGLPRKLGTLFEARSSLVHSGNPTAAKTRAHKREPRVGGNETRVDRVQR
jgi:hypothetical protein